MVQNMTQQNTEKECTVTIKKVPVDVWWAIKHAALSQRKGVADYVIDNWKKMTSANGRAK